MDIENNVKLDPIAEEIANKNNSLEENKIKTVNEEVTEIPPTGDIDLSNITNGSDFPNITEGLGSVIGGLMGGAGTPDYSEIFEQQIEIFKSFDENINKLDDNIAAVNDDLENTKSEIENIKLYSRLLTWVMLGIDILVVIAVIIIIIFK